MILRDSIWQLLPGPIIRCYLHCLECPVLPLPNWHILLRPACLIVSVTSSFKLIFPFLGFYKGCSQSLTALFLVGFALSCVWVPPSRLWAAQWEGHARHFACILFFILHVPGMYKRFIHVCWMSLWSGDNASNCLNESRCQGQGSEPTGILTVWFDGCIWLSLYLESWAGHRSAL